MHDVQHATAKKSVNYVICYTVRDVKSGTSRIKRLLNIIFFRTLKVISNKHLNVTNNFMNRPNHLIHHFLSSPVLPAALLHSPFHHYLHNMARMHAHTYAHTSSKTQHFTNLIIIFTTMLPVYGIVKSSDMVPQSMTENANTLSSYQTYAAGTIKRENFFPKIIMCGDWVMYLSLQYRKTVWQCNLWKRNKMLFSVKWNYGIHLCIPVTGTL